MLSLLDVARREVPPVFLVDELLDPGEVIVAVEDASPTPPQVKTVGPEATGGRGVALVEALAQEWGWQPHPPGKRVWFRLTDGA